jgi:hypothetical protein
VKDEPHRVHIRRHCDEPAFDLGAVIEVREGVFGVVLARFKPSDQKGNEVHYIVELIPERSGRGKSSG